MESKKWKVNQFLLRQCRSLEMIHPERRTFWVDNSGGKSGKYKVESKKWKVKSGKWEVGS